MKLAAIVAVLTALAVVTVQAQTATPSVTLSPDPVRVGGVVTVTWSGIPDPDWRWDAVSVHCTTDRPEDACIGPVQVGGASGAIQLTVPGCLLSGQYQAALWHRGAVIALSTPIQVIGPTATPVDTATPYPTLTPWPSLTPQATATAYPTYTAIPTWTPMPSPTETPIPTSTPTATATARATATPTDVVIDLYSHTNIRIPWQGTATITTTNDRQFGGRP